MKLMDMINEDDKKNRKFDFGCVMIYFTFPEFNKIQDIIDPKDLYEEEDDDSFGFDDDPHTTLLYGLHPQVTTEQVKKITDEFTFYTCKLHKPSLFENEKYDVLKFDVEEDTLNEVNKKLVKHPHTSDFPDYHPHMTIAYLIPGMGKKYVKKLNENKANKFWLSPQFIVYSQTDGSKDKISIKVD